MSQQMLLHGVSLLEVDKQLGDLGIRDGTELTLVLQQQGLRVCSHKLGMAFATIKRDGTLVTWGSPGSGGDSNAVREQLVDVQQIQAAGHAFAAIKSDGTVVTWVIQTMVVAAVPCEGSLLTCSRSRPLNLFLRRSRAMALW